MDRPNYAEILLHQWFSASGNSATPGTFGGTRDTVMVTLGEEGRMLLASGGERTERLLNILQVHRAAPTTKNDPVQLSVTVRLKNLALEPRMWAKRI